MTAWSFEAICSFNTNMSYAAELKTRSLPRGCGTSGAVSLPFRSLANLLDVEAVDACRHQSTTDSCHLMSTSAFSADGGRESLLFPLNQNTLEDQMLVLPTRWYTDMCRLVCCFLGSVGYPKMSSCQSFWFISVFVLPTDGL